MAYDKQSPLEDCTLSEGSKRCAIFESGAIYERVVQSLRMAGIQTKIHCKMAIYCIQNIMSNAVFRRVLAFFEHNKLPRVGPRP